MYFSFSPQRREDSLTLERTAPDRIRINGELFNFGPLADGDEIPASAVPCEWVVGSVRRINGELHLTLILPHGANPTRNQAFPESIHVTENGPIAVPFNSYCVEEDEKIEPCEEYPSGAVLRRTTQYHWMREPQVSEHIEPNSEVDNVDA